MNDLMWITKRSTNKRLTDDVSITTTKEHTRNNYTQFYIRFRNGCYLKIAKTDYIEYAVTGCRIYFRESNARDGFKLSSKCNNNKNASIKTSLDLSKFIGDYELKWSPELRLNYIELNESEDK